MFQDVTIRGYKFRVMLDPKIKIVVMEQDQFIGDDPHFQLALEEAYDSWQDMVDIIEDEMGWD